VIPLSLSTLAAGAGGVAAWAGFVAFAPPCTVACAAARYLRTTPPHCVAAAAASAHTPQSSVAMWPPGVTSVKYM